MGLVLTMTPCSDWLVESQTPCPLHTRPSFTGHCRWEQSWTAHGSAQQLGVQRYSVDGSSQHTTAHKSAQNTTAHKQNKSTQRKV